MVPPHAGGQTIGSMIGIAVTRVNLTCLLLYCILCYSVAFQTLVQGQSMNFYIVSVWQRSSFLLELRM